MLPVILGLLSTGVALSISVVPTYLDGLDGLTYETLWLGLAFILLFIGAPLVLTYTTFLKVRSIGVRFFRQGVEFGTVADTRAVRYEDLEYFCYLSDPTSQFPDFQTIAQFVISVLTLNPLGMISFSIDSGDPPVGMIVIKAPSQREIRVPIGAVLRNRLSSLLDGLPPHRPL